MSWARCGSCYLNPPEMAARPSRIQGWMSYLRPCLDDNKTHCESELRFILLRILTPVVGPQQVYIFFTPAIYESECGFLLANMVVTLGDCSWQWTFWHTVKNCGIDCQLSSFVYGSVLAWTMHFTHQNHSQWSICPCFNEHLFDISMIQQK